jgi:hypothetical protein
MSRVARMLGALLLSTAALCLAACWGQAEAHFAKADDAALTQADDDLRLIAYDWNIATLDRLIVPNFYAPLPRADVVKMFRTFAAKLGTLEHLKLLKSEERETVGTRGSTLEAQMYYRVMFEKAPGDVVMTMIQQNGRWRVEGFNVNSKAFFE